MDLFTKNLDGSAFRKHASVFHGQSDTVDEPVEEEECWSDDVMGDKHTSGMHSPPTRIEMESHGDMKNSVEVGRQTRLKKSDPHRKVWNCGSELTIPENSKSQEPFSML